ncbi:MAG TPA: VWA domain-containing protein [Vicinamibacterales bacterium]
MRGCARLRIAAVLILSASLSAAPRAQQQPFRAETRAVSVYATVTAPDGTIVTGLTAQDFDVRDNGVKQRILAFANDPQPISVAVLLDNSPSLFAAANRAEGTVMQFARLLRQGDVACLGTFGHVVTLVPELTGDPTVLIKHLGDDAPFPAGTALWDAIDAGRSALSGVSGRRVVLVVTDGADNCSRSNIDEVRAALVRDDVMVYAIGLRGREGLDGRDMDGIARATGGMYYELKPTDDIGAVMRRVAEELHQQYVLGFAPATLDDKLHRIDVKMLRPGLSVRARKSYVASTQAAVR